VSEASPAPDGSSRRRPSVALVLLVVLAVLLAVLAVLAAVEGVDRHNASLLDRARSNALASARQTALNLTSVDGQDIDGDLKRVQDSATGTFGQEFAQQSARLRGVLTDNKVVSEGRVLDAALVRGDQRTATVIVVADSLVKNKASPNGTPRTYRMQLDLEHHGDRWLTSSLQFVG